MTRADAARSPAAGILVLVLLSIGLAACAPFGSVCTAVGYPSIAQITMADPRDGLDLQLCDGENCEPGRPAQHDGSEPPPASDVPGIQDDGMISLTGDGATGWSADFIGGQPEVGYRLSTAAGEIIAEGSVDVDWVRVGGSEECGGPYEATIELPV